MRCGAARQRRSAPGVHQAVIRAIARTIRDNGSVDPVGDDRRRRLGFERVFREHYRAVNGFVTAHYPNLDTATIMSITFDIAWRRLDDIPPDAERGWLIGVARNCARNEARATRRRVSALDALVSARASDGLHPEPILEEHISTVVEAFRALAEADREIILLADWEQLSVADLAAALGVSTSAAGVRLHRARKRFRAYARGEGQP